MGDDANDVGLSRRHLTRALDASLTRLRVDCIDLYQVHAWDPHTPIEETLGFFDDVVRAGKVRYAGLSNFTGWQVQKTVDVAEARHLPRPVTLQPQYNLLAREVEWEIVPACVENGLGLLPWSPLGGGWLTGKYTRDQQPSGATRLGEDPGRGVEAYDKRAASERTWAVVDAVQGVAEARGVVDGRRRARLAARPAGGVLGDPRRPHHRPADRQPGRRRAAPEPGGGRPPGRGQRPGPGGLPLRARPVAEQRERSL